MNSVDVEIIPKLIPIMSQQKVMYRCSWGGRGSGKTRTFAVMTAIRGYMYAEQGIGGVILCAREFMNTLSESSMEEIKQAIKEVPFLNDYYELGESYIRSKNRKIDYIFAGLRHNLDSIKSKARILLCWVDEAESVSQMAWDKLEPTIRGIDDAEIWVTWNPEKRGSPCDTKFRHNEIYDPDTNELIGVGAEINWRDNPRFPKILDRQRRLAKRNLSPEKYEWIWEGAYLEMSEAVVFKGKFVVKEFEPDYYNWDGPYQGLDFGFSQDPTAGVQCFIHNRKLYIYRDFSKVGLELDDTKEYALKFIPDFAKYAIIADNARPESISHLKNKGLARIESCKKGKGSVEDGVSFIQSFDEVVIHPSCEATIQEFKTYSYKTDRLTGDVLPILLDENNHIIDSLRYALERARGGASMLDAM
ncbi:MAG: PBSX family phage terminase large subunit [Acinetobacter sp.]